MHTNTQSTVTSIQSGERKSGNSLNLLIHATKSKCSNEKMSKSMLKIYYTNIKNR